ncbi:hypothetical protein ACHWQZ_G015174 [Mnemiopsis leidyi]
MGEGEEYGAEGSEENYFSYNFTHRKPPERGADNSIKQIGKIKRLLKRLQDANTETDHEPSCLVLDPSMYGDPGFGLLFFFMEISEYEGYENSVDLAYLNTLFERGADINATDKIGQTVLHDVARLHKATTAKYFIRSGIDVNAQDTYGRTALHIAAQRDYEEMVELLIESGAKKELITNGSCFTPLHCAAMGDAPGAIRVLIDADSDKEARDYRGRTPLLIAAEYDRRSAAQKLIELGVTTKVVDYSGLHALSILIAKMPKLAMQALDQCFSLDSKSRELKVWINYMEPDLLVPKDARYGFSVLYEVSRSGDLDLVQNPAIKALISTKWKQFGQRAVIKEIGLYLIYLISWSLLMILTPLKPPKGDGDEYDRGSRRIITETVAYIFYIGFVLDEIGEARSGQQQQKKWKNMRIGQVESDLKVVRPLSEMDQAFLNSEMMKAVKQKSQYFGDYWNIFDWIVYSLQFVGIVIYLYCEVAVEEPRPGSAEEQHAIEIMFRRRSQLMATAILLSWFKVFKYLRVFKSMGPFVVIITHSFGDIGKISLVYVILYIPMVCIFYQFYGNQNIPGYQSVDDVMFTVFRMIVVDDYNYNSLIITGAKHEPENESSNTTEVLSRMKRKGNYEAGEGVAGEVEVEIWWTRFLVAYWILVSSVILLNLFIALMSDTFQRVYDNAVGVAALEKAEIIAELEGKLNKKSRDRYLKDLEDNYSPLCEFTEISEADDASEEIERLDHLQNRLDRLEKTVIAANESFRKQLREQQEEQIYKLNQLDSKLTEIYLKCSR